MINKDGGGGTIFGFYGGHNCYEGGHRAHGGPLTGENPDVPHSSPDKICYILPHHQYSNMFLNYK